MKINKLKEMFSALPGEIHDVINNTDSDFELLAISAPAFSPEDSIDCEMPKNN